MKKRVVSIGAVKIGDGHPIAVQSMTKTKTRDINATIRQIKRLERAGCELVRLAVVNKDDALALKKIKESVSIPLIADIHFDYRLALQAIESGVDKVRINPGNIGADWKLKKVIIRARERHIPIRIGVNAGSLPGDILKKYRHPDSRALVETVEHSLELFDKFDFKDIVISAKGADVRNTVDAYSVIHRKFSFPLHLGITEAGPSFTGGIRSGVGLGILLHRGIGDTIRVSLTADPVKEVTAGFEILNSLGLRKTGPVLISCPLCGRCEVELMPIVRSVQKRLKRYKNFMKVAVMGCVVNGPGEAREADFGIACGKGMGAVFSKGREIKRVKESILVDTLFEVIDENFDN
ncbi:4-hydroxy-3-methylbut-2-en-1-yl diphosphate synthase [candidate division WOR-3 bacterium 4484_100]|uniref:4-hydroxy-3-methylbut-2-en-1-yl diphosphate synthase (flavodoxin) n=1 Tax=candidate division WOR-3 bacterium 4484_100 TaxID=1936077 RepID=A0A1V4QH91_UNCW3|nr:MAG: 4-hydroxy-3-methylbut-2-en-1-yl diphosphate synthase [candidate division WOR-3 bacterium 4484_100]